MLKGQNGAKGMWRREAHMSGVMDCGTSECSKYLFFLISFYTIYLTKLLEPPFFFFLLHKEKTKQSHVSIDIKQKESGKQCFNW